MIVTTLTSDGKSKSILRGGHVCHASRNMSYIEIEYEKNGQREWFRILPEDLKRLLVELPEYNSQGVIELILEYDEEITPEMQRQWTCEEFGREIADEAEDDDSG